MLSNSLAGGLLATSYIITLVLQLNPTLPLHPVRLAPLVTTVGLFYAIHFTVGFYVLLVLRQLFAREVFSPAWISVSVLVWIAALSALAGATVMWANLSTFALVLDETTKGALSDGAAVLAAVSVCLAALGLVRWWIGPAWRRTYASVFVVLAVVSVLAPVAIRGRGVVAPLPARPLDATVEREAVERSARVVVVAIDAGSLDFVTAATNQGRLPNFGRVLDAGAVMRVATIHPTSAEAVWAAAVTGKLPQKNGVRSAVTYRLTGGADPIQLLPEFCFARSLLRFGFLAEEPLDASTFRTRTLWGILSTRGVSVGVVGWPLTQPAPAVRGYLVSDRYHRLSFEPSGIVDARAVYPTDIEGETARAMEPMPTDPPAAAAPAGDRDRRDERPSQIDRGYDRIARELAATRPAQVTMTRYQSLDPIGHYFLRYAMPYDFGDVSDEERRRLGPVLERHYGIVDEAIGRALASLGPDDLLLVVSGYGMDPLEIAQRIAERVFGEPELSGTHDHAPDGFLLAYGTTVAAGHPAVRASVADLTPTILYFLGLPIGRDMDGYARTDLFLPAFTADRPITFIPTYDR